MRTGRSRPAEEALVAAAVEGDGGAIDAIWRANRRWIAAVLLAHKPRAADLDDLLQDVAMTVVRKISTLRDETNLRAWLRVVAVNTARAAGRTSARRPRLRLQPDGDDPRLAEDVPIVEHREEVRRILGRLAALPDEYREPLVLRALQGMRSKQIGEILDLPPATVDTRIARARRMLLDLRRDGAGDGRETDCHTLARRSS